MVSSNNIYLFYEMKLLAILMGKWENGSVEGGADQVEQRLHIQGFNQGDDG